MLTAKLHAQSALRLARRRQEQLHIAATAAPIQLMAKRATKLRITEKRHVLTAKLHVLSARRTARQRQEKLLSAATE